MKSGVKLLIIFQPVIRNAHWEKYGLKVSSLEWKVFGFEHFFLKVETFWFFLKTEIFFCLKTDTFFLPWYWNLFLPQNRNIFLLQNRNVFFPQNRNLFFFVTIPRSFFASKPKPFFISKLKHFFARKPFLLQKTPPSREYSSTVCHRQFQFWKFCVNFSTCVNVLTFKILCWFFLTT